jgi:NADP-dependent 3-hydroxy acid dehydrogenase YdfG
MTQHASPRVWVITGAGRGFGRLCTEAALAAGDRVIATARTPATLDDLRSRFTERLVVLPLDVTDRRAVFATVDRAIAAFGHLDVVLNNAG